MNKERREVVAQVLASLQELSAKLGPVAEEERAAQENKPEALQNTDAADLLDSAVSEIDSAIESLESVE